MKLSDVMFWSFTEHDLSEEMLKLIPYEFCSEVQAASLQPILSGKDV
jgi:superfamily II DNA/RNA helicase